ncbi:carboxypeptidase-like regulatory domain-containing protein [Winogradskyella litoriviva]|uniref:Carboxypeptidase-like regulatory domain-containing protein n=1 Tax=Winogradskyella litoriviva TaxID=1220182 RepID=A0ABX2E207_9FLAO|nr:carboxypeptidase-like regulatory domain-containing protein [Winogradskyella litoriviva]NRD22528.1 carboxypeptidase-like regulatory domain-containing protein [Winogradskyella litoriviva]
MNYLALFTFTCIQISLYGQTLEGEVLDSSNKRGLSYANLSIKNKRIGVYTDENGKYNLDLSKISEEDTLIISLVGYQKQKIALSQFVEEKPYTLNFQLISKIETLKEILILSKTKTYSSTAFKISTGNKNQTFPFSVPYGNEVAVLIENPKNKKGRLLELQLKFKNIKEDKFKIYRTYYRIAFYKIDSLGFPGDLVHFKNIIIKPEIDLKNLKIDLQNKSIPFSKKGIFVAIETIKPEFVKLESKMYLTTPNILYTHTKNSIEYIRFHANVWHKQSRKSPFKKKHFAVPYIKVKVNYEMD